MKEPRSPGENLNRYLAGRGDATARYASFDHCYNFFRGYWEQGRPESLADTETRQTSCLQLGYYLASWGMFRGKATLLQRSSRSLIPAIEVIAAAPAAAWTTDIEQYDDDTIAELIHVGRTLRAVLPGGRSDTLVTKTMLGVFGTVPAFDRFFRKGFGTSGFHSKALIEMHDYYRRNHDELERFRIRTIDFDGTETTRRYTQAKVIDMLFFIEGGGAG